MYDHIGFVFYGANVVPYMMGIFLKKSIPHRIIVFLFDIDQFLRCNYARYEIFKKIYIKKYFNLGCTKKDSFLILI